jgi:hypothetical protein
VCSVFRAVRRARCVERVPWILVHLRAQILDFILVDYSYQVGHYNKVKKEQIIELNSEQFTGQSGHGKDSLRPFDHE